MQTSSRQEIPIFPLNTVLFPGGMLPLKIFEPRYIDMMKVCLRDNTPLGICLIREGKEVGVPAIPESVGCLANIVEWDMPQLGVFYLQTLGTDAFRIVDRTVAANGLTHAVVECRPTEGEIPIDPKYQVCVEVLRSIIEQAGSNYPTVNLNYQDAVWVIYRLAELLPIDLVVKQRLLEMESVALRAKLIHELLKQHGVTNN
jgi:uncharacterized protein